ncbi:TetR/AcrR family transcriptional regulator [Cellulosimicrobium cellulans]|uniref:TetR/AcrR family transcriptional regulator n=1 Tax=Cellulosimicrobium cellulans TaxID=1710 RepID=UPI0018845845|nr:TetR/AcrR family transcriptional regulator [Cellulosimicrobium cellulans]MBE9926661.1 TetR/AcrR family transcriptional regulator [Cellulosimicrobium cellulans]
MDKRTARTAAALRTAILALAAEQDVTRLTVSAVAARAGINRVTFYDHASSPSELLARVLGAELDAIRDRFFADVRAAETADDVAARSHEVVDHWSHALVVHVEAHLPVYERALEGGLSAPLFRLLAGHVTGTLVEHLHAHPSLLPSPPAGTSAGVSAGPTTTATADVAARAFATYVGFGTVGALEVWLATPPPRDPGLFPRVARDALPAWWTTPSP